MAIINCPECGKEVSDTATCCVHCGYNLKKNSGLQKKKKYLIICGLAALAVAAILIFIVLNLNRGIVGTWEIDHYDLDGEIISTDDIGDYFGSEFGEMQKKFYVKFQKGGSFILSMPNYGEASEVYEGTYKVNDDVVRMEVDGDSVDMFVIKGNTLILGEQFGGYADGGLNVIFKKR